MGVTCDRHSLIVDGRRVFLRSGAFHYYRLPSTGLWRDRLWKIKRAGYNAVDLYFSWAYHSPTEGEWDFSGIRDVDYLLGLTEEVGLYVVARPGPYINSELSGGGLPGWLINKHRVPLRCIRDGAYVESPEYLKYARQWYEQIVPRIARCPNLVLFQIENEHANDDLTPDYMQRLYDWARQLGIEVPIFHNDGWGQGCWAGLVDIYAVDTYAVTRFDADWRIVPETFRQVDALAEIYNEFAPGSPRFVAELQGGWFDPWDGRGYDALRKALGKEALELVTWSAVAQGVTLYNHYMFVGGTNWDHIGCPAVNTSYDFAAPVQEWGGLSQRYHAAKAMACQNGALEGFFTEAEAVQDVACSDAEVFYRALGNGEARVIFLRNLTGQRRSTTIQVGAFTVPPVTLASSEMRPVVVNLELSGLRIAYATSSILGALAKDGEQVLVFVGEGSVAFDLPIKPEVLKDELGSEWEGSRWKIHYAGSQVQELVFSAEKARYTLVFIPDANQAWLVEDTLILGPDYVGESRMDGEILDWEMYSGSGGQVRVYAAGRPPRITMDGRPVAQGYDPGTGKVSFLLPKGPALKLPALDSWRVAGACPEIAVDYDDRAWHVIPTGGRTDMDSLGIYQGVCWYRGEFHGKMAELSLTIRHNAAIYLNGKFVARLDNYQNESWEGGPETEGVEPVAVALPEELCQPGRNVVAVLVESLGHNKGYIENVRLPRGLLAWASDREIRWRFRPGFTGEAEGFDAIDYEDGGWTAVKDLSHAPRDDVVWARCHFQLGLPPVVYAPLGLVFEGVADKAHIYLNGVLIARDWSISPQRKFYLPEGLLDPHGQNTLAILLWRRGGPPANGRVYLEPYGVQWVYRCHADGFIPPEA
ncbi:MAG: beta-galactosidase [Chloroflexi bacterium]|nr:beta-galactosidase [Chloroflexota bacterium]